MALRTRPAQFPELGSGVQTEQITPASRLVSYLTGFAIQPNKAIVGANAFAHESGIHQDGYLKNPLTYEIMTPQSVGLQGSTLSIGKLSGRRGLQGKLRELGHDVDGEQLDAVYRAAIALADTKKEVTDADLIALVEQRKADVPRSIELLGWSISSSSGGHSLGSVSLVCVGEARAADSTGNGPVNALFKAVDEAVRPVAPLEPGPHRVRDQGRVGRGRGRAGPGAGPLPAILRRGPGRARRHGPRVEHQHHRGVARGVPRRDQQAPRRGDQRRRGGVRRPPAWPRSSRDGCLGGAVDGDERRERHDVPDRADPGRRRRAGGRRGGGHGPRGGGPAVRLRRSTGPSSSSAGRRSTRTASPSGPRTSRRAATPTRCCWARAAARSGTTRTPRSAPSRRCSRCAAASGCSPTCARSPSSPS